MPASDTVTALENTDGPTVQSLWAAVLAAARWTRDSASPQAPCTFAADPADGLHAVAETSPEGLLQRHPSLGWITCTSAPSVAKAFLDLYLPLCNASAQDPLTVAHLGQSLDGFIATRSGDSDYVTGPENLLHLHRMRALCDAVLVGAETIAMDDPQLTVRRTSGDNPVRIVLDPQRRLGSAHGVFTDGAAATLLVCDEALIERADEKVGAAEVLGLPMREDGLDLRSLLTALRARQLWTIFVEGGGRTISTFLEQGLLDRLQIAVAPLIIGTGRPGIHLRARERLSDCPRLSPRVITTGSDILFDCDLRRGGAGAQSEQS
jgi:diaminohydroxyphosphoribosylaminopyrimidine deaminase / 5-amino-6-(5-phosphoribosylamino)uracil reductase